MKRTHLLHVAASCCILLLTSCQVITDKQAADLVKSAQDIDDLATQELHASPTSAAIRLNAQAIGTSLGTPIVEKPTPPAPILKATP